MKRACVVCGKHLDIKVNPKTRDYTGGHYFGELSGDGEGEYWECNECYEKDWAE